MREGCSNIPRRDGVKSRGRSNHQVAIRAHHPAKQTLVSCGVHVAETAPGKEGPELTISIVGGQPQLITGGDHREFEIDGRTDGPTGLGSNTSRKGA